MREYIYIKNFGPINEVELNDIRPFTILVGESGSGKSTIMKLLVLFRWIYKMVNIRSYLYHSGISKSPFRFSFNTYLKNGELDEYIIAKKSPEIIYRINDYEISYKDGKLNAKIIIRLEDICLNKLSFISEQRNIIPDILNNKLRLSSVVPFYLEETYNDFLIADKVIDNINIDYLNIRYLKQKTARGAKRIVENINGEDKYSIPLSAASSGIKTVIPLSIITEYFAKHYNFQKEFNKTIFKFLSDNDKLTAFRPNINIGDINSQNIYIHIEEPELSLFPESQRELVNFLVNRCAQVSSTTSHIHLILSTHSPYIVNHMNLLIMAALKEKGVGSYEANIAFENISVYEIIDGCVVELNNDQKSIIDTTILSEPIKNTYIQYQYLESNK